MEREKVGGCCRWGHRQQPPEMTITRVIEVEVNSVTPLSACRAVLCSWTGEGADRLNAGACDLQEADPFDMSMGAQYKVIGVEEIDA